VRVRKRAVVQKFFADRGTHLAAMIAYFALLSFVPLTFLSLSVLGLTGRADESSFLVTELKHALPGSEIGPIVSLVRAVQDNATTLGIIGGAALLWTSLSLFSVLESALNIVYGKPNRGFLRGKALAFLFMAALIITLFLALLAGSIGVAALRRYAPGFVSSTWTAYAVSIGVSMIGVFAFLLSIYLLLPNTDVDWRDVLPGTIAVTIGLEASFQVLPVYERFAGVNPALRAFGGPAILLVWLYVMANLVVFGAEINWWRAQRRNAAPPSAERAGRPSPSAEAT
jgi:membrane protein